MIKISQFVKIFKPEVPQQVLIMSRYLDKSQKVSTNLEKPQKISKILTVSIYLDSLDKNLDTAESRLKSLDFKNLNREIKIFSLDTMDNLDGFQKLISTD